MNRIIALLIAALSVNMGTIFPAGSSTADMNPLAGRSIAVVGDSIGRGDKERGAFGEIIASENNMQITNVSIGGATMAQNVKWSQDAEGFRPCIADRLDMLEGGFDYILLEGGVNDYWSHVQLGELTAGKENNFDTDTFAGGIETLFHNTVTNFPDSKKGFIIIHNPFTYDAEAGFEPYYQMMKDACNKWNIPYIDLYSKNNRQEGVNVRDAQQKQLYFGNTSDPQGDGCHPNELGYKVIYVEPVTEWLKTL